jgi:hypothetical protein
MRGLVRAKRAENRRAVRVRGHEPAKARKPMDETRAGPAAADAADRQGRTGNAQRDRRGDPEAVRIEPAALFDQSGNRAIRIIGI